jgi:hypothetical protein
VSEHDSGAPGAATAATVHPCLCCVFMILLSGVPGGARLSFYDGHYEVPPISLKQERHTQRRKATFIYLFIFMKSPP